MSSDNFFKNNQDKFDLIFIDGLHQYEQVKRDVYNSLKFLNDNGVILLHDCMPSSFMRQAPKRSSNIWNGDVWKNIVEFRTLDQIDTYTIYADHGIGLILKRKNRNKLLLKIESFDKLKFQDYYKNYKLFLNIVNFKDLNQLF
jgi:predicted O-methyltransferase YrrM